MSQPQITAGLSAFGPRGAGTDAERRAAAHLADALAADGREVLIEPFWCRPNSALAHAAHAAIGLAGSLVAVHNPRVGAGILLVATLSVISDALFGVSLGRRITPERASQNVVALPPRGTRRRRVSLILTANYDSGRMGLVNRDAIRRPIAGARSLLRGWTLGWLGWLTVALLALLGVAIARYEGSTTGIVAVAQLIPTIGLVIAVAALTERSGAPYSPGVGDNGSGVEAVMALVRSLDAEPLTEAAVHVVLTGAGDDAGIGLRTYLRGRRRSLRAHNTVVVGVAPCAAGAPRFWQSDGAFVPVRYFRELRRLCREAGAEQPDLGLRAHRGRGLAPALPARLGGIPAVAIGTLDERGLSPHSRQPADVVEALDPGALADTIELGLLLVDGIDGFLGEFTPRVEAAQQRRGLGARLGAIADWVGRPRIRRPTVRRKTS